MPGRRCADLRLFRCREENRGHECGDQQQSEKRSGERESVAPLPAQPIGAVRKGGRTAAGFATHGGLFRTATLTVAESLGIQARPSTMSGCRLSARAEMSTRAREEAPAPRRAPRTSKYSKRSPVEPRLPL